MNKRLLAVQGPIQFIAGILALEWYEKLRPASPGAKSVLLLYDFLGPDSIEAEFVEIINRMASIREWHSVVFISGKDMGTILEGGYSGSIRKMRATVGEDEFDEVYVARDYCGQGSPLLINSYKTAHKIMFGDSLGIVGNEAALDRFNWNSPIKSLASICKRRLRRWIYGGPERLPFDAAVLVLPIVCSRGYLDDVPVFIPTKDFVINAVRRIYARLDDLRERCDDYMSLSGAHGSPLFLLSNLHGSGLMCKENEVALYLQVIRENAVRGGTILLKAHPRNSNEVLDELASQLASDYKLVVINDPGMSRLPIELWVRLIESCTIVPIFSTSAINLKYIYGKTVLLPLNESLIGKYFYRSKSSYVREGNRFIQEAIDNLTGWDGESVLLEFEFNL